MSTVLDEILRPVDGITRPRAGLVTLGCKVNQYETERIADALWLAGFDLGTHDQPLDLCVINSCSVTSLAGAKSRQMIRKLKRRNPFAVVVATGCGTEADRCAIEGVEEIDLVIPNLEKDVAAERILDFLRREKRFPLPPPRQNVDPFERESSRTRALLKVQDGCDYFCSFCIIPYTRGPRRSQPWDRVLREARGFVSAGHKEIVITGICVGTYNDNGRGLPELLQALAEIEGLERIRLSSIEPNDVTDRLIRYMADNPKICRHFHIPLQSGDDEILQAMNRRYNTAQYLRTIEKMREALPGVVFTTDLMVGFPGEEERHFQNTLRVVKAVDYFRLHVFPYSRRWGTKSYNMPNQVEDRVKDERVKILLEISREQSRRYYQKALGQVVKVLVERQRSEEGEYTSLTDTYLRVHFHSNKDLEGQIVSVRITEAREDSCYGVLVEG